MNIYIHYKFFFVLVFQSVFMSSCAVSLPLWALQKLETFAAQNKRVTELQNIMSWKGPIRIIAGSTYFFPQGNKSVSRILLNFLWSILGTGWWPSDSVLCGHRENPLCSLTSVLSVRLRFTSLTRFGNRENFLPGKLGRENISWDV